MHQWPHNKTAALSFTFDDARATQLSNGIPLFNKWGIKSTFYVLPRYMRDVANEWRQVALDGHEIGNHTVTHPCNNERAKTLESFTLEQMEAEIGDANRAIEEMTGVRPQTFAYPCGQAVVGSGDNQRNYVPLIARHFVAARATVRTGNDPASCDLHHLHAVGIDRADVPTLKTFIDTAHAQNQWLIFYGHEIGDAEGRGMALDALEEVCRYATSFDDLWIDTVAAIAGQLV